MTLSSLRLYTICCCIIFSIWKINAQMSAQDFLKTDGTVIRNQSGIGDTINLRGTNLGSWLSMEYWMGPVGKGSLDRSTWQATASSTYSGTNPQNVFDRDSTTRWANGQAQVADSTQFFMVNLQQPTLFNRVSFEAANFIGDYPRGYLIEVSDDGIQWESVATGSESTENIFVQLPALYYKQYIKITQTGSATNNFWSISEFNLFMEDDFTVRNSLILRFGEQQTDSLLDVYQENWITTTDLDSIQNLGMNMVRIPVYWMEFMKNDGSIKPNGFDQIDWVVNECSSRNMYVIIDLHGAPGGINGFITSGQAFFNEYWESTYYQNLTIDIWKAIAQRYKDNPTVAAYDLLNEPLSTDQQQYPIHYFYNQLYQEVRAIDPDHIISIGAFPGFDFVVDPSYYGWENVLYQVHHYNEDKTNYASQNGFIEAVTLAMANHMYNWNVPILAGEFNFWDFPDLWAKYITSLNALNISWSNWAYKVKREDIPKENWGYFDNAPLPIPDIHYDPYDTIALKWSQFKTVNFHKNQELFDIIFPHTLTEVSKPPYGKIVAIKASNQKYLSSEGNDNPMTFTRDSIAARETFNIVDAGNGLVALLGSNNQYVSFHDGQLFCDANSIDDTEKFDFIQFGNQKIALRGVNKKYISAEDGNIPATCNRSTIDGWELFQWEELPSNITANFSKLSFTVTPNPATDTIQINATVKKFTIEILDMNGNVQKQFNRINSGDKLKVNNLKPGVYFIKLLHLGETLTHKIIIN